MAHRPTAIMQLFMILSIAALACQSSFDCLGMSNINVL